MIGNFIPSLGAVLVHEGGFTNNPRDPGGATNKGVTQRVYDDWRLHEKLAPRSVRHINDYEVGAIYRKRYWDACRCDDLPAGVDYCVFDFAVNSGTNRAARYLQKAAGVLDDGMIGPVTIAAVRAEDSVAIIEKVCAARLNFLRQLTIFDAFGRGWTRRVEEVCTRAKAMAQ
jgi:lysozyme family protein